MEDQSNTDHLNSSLTDLMTSLMVIFILLLLVFVHRTAGKDAAVTDVLLKTTAARHDSPRASTRRRFGPIRAIGTQFW